MTNSLGATKFMSHVEHLEFGNLAIWHFGILAFFSSGRHLLRFWIRSQSLVVFLVLLGRLCPLRQRSVLPPPPRNWHKGTTSNGGGPRPATTPQHTRPLPIPDTFPSGRLHPWRCPPPASGSTTPSAPAWRGISFPPSAPPEPLACPTARALRSRVAVLPTSFVWRGGW